LGPKSYVPDVPYAKSKVLDRSAEFRKDMKLNFQIDEDNKTIGRR
jgi:hypothetical protein